MRFPLLALAFVLAASTVPSRAQTAAGVGPLTLAEALRLAETASPALRAREAQLAAAQGSRRQWHGGGRQAHRADTLVESDDAGGVSDEHRHV